MLIHPRKLATNAVSGSFADALVWHSVLHHKSHTWGVYNRGDRTLHAPIHKGSNLGAG